MIKKYFETINILLKIILFFMTTLLICFVSKGLLLTVCISKTDIQLQNTKAEKPMGLLLWHTVSCWHELT